MASASRDFSGLFAWIAIARQFGFDGPHSALMAVLWCGLPMIAWSLLVDRVHRNPSAGIDWSAPPRPLTETLDISISKITGLWTTWGIIAVIYCIGRWYWEGNYQFSMMVLGTAGPWLVGLSVPYVFWLDRRLKDPRATAPGSSGNGWRGRASPIARCSTIISAPGR